MVSALAWLDGKFISHDQFILSPVTHSLSYASSVYEGMRSYEGKIFKCKEHLQRLRRSAQLFKHEFTYTDEKLSTVCDELLQKNNLQNAYVKIIIFYDGQDVSFMGRGCNSKVLIFVLPVALKSAVRPYRLTKAGWKRAPADCHPYQAKTSSTYALSFLSFREKDNDFDDVLFFSIDNIVCESSGSNIFFLKSKQLITPTTDMVLAGITRAIIIDEISSVLDLQVIQRDISSSELDQFDSAFLCGTAMEITEVCRINETSYQKSELIEKLQAEYKKLVHSHSLREVGFAS